MTNPVPLRIGDAERDRAVAALGDHYAAGRLTAEEFDDRSSRAWQARTAEDLAPLFADLPGSRAVVEPAWREWSVPGRRHPGFGTGFRPPLLFLPVVLLAVAVAVIVALPWPLLILFWWWALGSLFRFAHWRGSAGRRARSHGWA
ncbi:MAG TPA: DUF1707 domain-containing protein [Jiangellaceae bacterium]|nr:DUF1707 domain-containing protein [Jiangellaceae bacterium]